MIIGFYHVLSTYNFGLNRLYDRFLTDSPNHPGVLEAREKYFIINVLINLIIIIIIFFLIIMILHIYFRKCLNSVLSTSSSSSCDPDYIPRRSLQHFSKVTLLGPFQRSRLEASWPYLSYWLVKHGILQECLIIAVYRHL